MKSKRIIRWTLMACLIFLSGFLMGAKQMESKWVGNLVFGKESPKSNYPTVSIPPPDPYISNVDSDIIIGLREDGVVVWKRRDPKN